MIIGSDEWLTWRKQKITATDSAVILGISPYRTALELWAEKLNLIDPPVMNIYMQRGNDLEPEAREKFQDMMSVLVFPCAIEHKTIPWMAASIDGITLERDLIVEIKANGPKTHSLALKGIVVDHHN